eukprot:2028888-Rhodomonas_salina.1
MAELRPLCCPQDMSILKAQGFMSLLLKRTNADVMKYVEEAMGMWTWVSSLLSSHVSISVCRGLLRLGPLVDCAALQSGERPTRALCDVRPRHHDNVLLTRDSVLLTNGNELPTRGNVLLRAGAAPLQNARGNLGPPRGGAFPAPVAR